MIVQERIVSPTPSQQLVTPLPEIYRNDNWLYANTEDAWLYTDYRQLERDISTEAETTAYKLPEYEEDLDCYNCTRTKTNAEILDKLKALEPEWIEF